MKEIVIKISDEVLSFVYQNGFIEEKDRNTVHHAILECVELPKGHDKLIAEPTEEEIAKTIGGNNEFADCIREAVKAVFNNANSVIEADKEYKVEVVTRGNCMICGKELTEGLFFCKECEDKVRSGKRGSMTREELKTEVMRWTPALLGMGKECTDKTLEAQKAIVDMLEHQPQGGLISRKAVLELTKIISEDYSRERASFQYFVENLPSVEPQEWISVKEHGNPTMSDDYWVTIQYPATRVVEKVFFSYEQNKWYYVYSDKILAWQTIEPSPYKGEV